MLQGVRLTHIFSLLSRGSKFYLPVYHVCSNIMHHVHGPRSALYIRREFEIVLKMGLFPPAPEVIQRSYAIS